MLIPWILFKARPWWTTVIYFIITVIMRNKQSEPGTEGKFWPWPCWHTHCSTTPDSFPVFFIDVTRRQLSKGDSPRCPVLRTLYKVLRRRLGKCQVVFFRFSKLCHSRCDKHAPLGGGRLRDEQEANIVQPSEGVGTRISCFCLFFFSVAQLLRLLLFD